MKGIKSFGIILGVGLGVLLLVLGTKALKNSTKDTYAQAQYAYGQVVEIKLEGFYKTCNDKGLLLAYDGNVGGIYTVQVYCPKDADVQTQYTFKLKPENIIKVIEETEE